MCLSASVSFTGSGLLLAGEGFTSHKAWVSNKKCLSVALPTGTWL